ncbi:hypothetical protein [Paraconexibacter sp.]|uniref:hypothetical protein n=1 Tax=Paraconexibacter sp. TaxID=2949640 RepID=UPI0035629409
MTDPKRPPLSPTARVLLAIAGVACAVGVVLFIVTSGTGDILGVGAMGVGATLVVSVVFLMIGEAEDRDRQRRPHG